MFPDDDIFTKDFGVIAKVGSELHRVIFDPGSAKEKTVRGTVIKDMGPFIFGTHIQKLFIRTYLTLTLPEGKKEFQVKEIEKSAAGTTYFLEEKNGREDYLDKET